MRTLWMASVVAMSLAAVVACNREGQAVQPGAGVQPGAAAPQAQAPQVAAPAVAPPAAGQAQPEAAPAGDKQYTAIADAVTLKVGATGEFKLTIKPAAGLHFNAEYPAKFAVTAAAFAKSTKDKLSSKGGEVKIEGENGVVSVPLQGLAAGSGNLEIVGSFSVCSSEQCYMLRDEKLAMKVTVN